MGLQAYRDETDLEAEAAELDPVWRDLDDRRAHMRAHDRWKGQLRGRACPSIEDVEPADVAGPRDILIDLRSDPADPELSCVGGALLAECGTRGIKRLSQIPCDSFLALLTGRYRQALSSRQPVEFEGEQVMADGIPTSYRGILLPLSSDGETIDFIHGTISWREMADGDLVDEIESELDRIGMPPSVLSATPIWPRAASEPALAARLGG